MMPKTIVPHRDTPSRPIGEMWKEYCDLLIATKRPGIKRLLNWMQSSDVGGDTMNFVNAPASTRFHGNYPGGLLEHSLNVYYRLMMLISLEQSTLTAEEKMTKEETEVYVESATIVSLLHDVCKAAFYVPTISNKKVYSESGSKSDELGQYDWVPEKSYKVKDMHKLGHGEASVQIIQQFLGVTGLSLEEQMAIRYHMADFENDYGVGDVYNRFPLAVLLHVADISATYLDERECDGGLDDFWNKLRAYARPTSKDKSATT